MKKKVYKPYIGHSRSLMNMWIKIRVLTHFMPMMWKGELSPVRFLRFCRRLLFFLSLMKDNKYSGTSRGVKINLYVPAFPAPAFFHACEKVKVFEGKMPGITALVSVTSACRYDCEHCYQKLDQGKDVEIGLLVDAVRKLQDGGVAFFNIEGGEPFLVYDRLKKVCEAIGRRSEILINSTGDGLTASRLKELNRNDNLLGIMFSLHTHDPVKLNAFMRSDRAWSNLESGIAACHEAGMAVTFNSCLGKADYYDGTFEKVMDAARNFGGSLIQMIKPKPAGGWLESGAEFFSPEDLDHIRQKLLDFNNLRAFRDYPAIAPMIIDEDLKHFGCTAGGTDRFYLNAKGDVQPCEFLNISFGNISTEPFEVIYERMRRVFEIPGDCWLCEKYSPEVARIFKENGLESLPLSPELSKNLYESLERGKAAWFYEKVEKI